MIVVPGVTNLTVRVSQKKTHISFEYQYFFLEIQLLTEVTEPQYSHGSAGG